MSVHRCPDCGVLILARQECETCERQTVQVITTLGAASDRPGIHAYATIGRVA